MTVRDLKNVLERFDNDFDVQFVLRENVSGPPMKWTRRRLDFKRAGTMPSSDRTGVVEVVELLLDDR